MWATYNYVCELVVNADITTHVTTHFYQKRMNKLIITIALSLLTSLIAIASTPPTSGDDSIVRIDQIEEKVMIEFLRESDLLTKRPIRIFDEEGREIFKAKARKFEKITEINMSNVKQGTYIIQMVLRDKLIDYHFVKEG